MQRPTIHRHPDRQSPRPCRTGDHCRVPEPPDGAEEPARDDPDDQATRAAPLRPAKTTELPAGDSAGSGSGRRVPVRNAQVPGPHAGGPAGSCRPTGKPRYAAARRGPRPGCARCRPARQRRAERWVAGSARPPPRRAWASRGCRSSSSCTRSTPAATPRWRSGSPGPCSSRCPPVRRARRWPCTCC